MKTILILIIGTVISFKIFGQSIFYPQNGGSIDRFYLISIKYDTKEVRYLDSLSKIDSSLKHAISYRVYFEMPGFHFQQRIHSDTLEITNYKAIGYIKIAGKLYHITN